MKLSKLADAAGERHQQVIFAETRQPMNTGERIEVDLVFGVYVRLSAPKLVVRILAIDAKSCARFDGQGEPGRAKRYSGLKLLRE